MAAVRNVRDVPAEEFIKAYAAHLKSNDKVTPCLKPGAPGEARDTSL